MMSKQKIGLGLVALAFVLILILVRYATLYWLEVLAVPIMGLVALGAPRGQGLKLVLLRSRASVRRCARLATG